MRSLPIVVAIPVKNEEAQIGACLESLGTQTKNFDRLVLLLNNCTDTTLEICRHFAAHRPGVEIHEATLLGDLASAGEARRLALLLAQAAEPDAIILTTDADAVPDRSWIEMNMREIAAGAQVVCGLAELHPRDEIAIPRALRDDAAREAFLLAVLDEITVTLNPDPFDPWPRHQQQSGASIAMRSDILHLAGGPPHVSRCEDRVLIEKLRLVDARIRHAPDIRVRVSGRLEGRAAGGMAEAMKRRMVRQDALTDEKLEPAIDALRRAMAQARLRAVRGEEEEAAAFARDMLIDPIEMNRILQSRFHGQAWAEIQASSPVLHRRRVTFAGLPREIRVAVALRDRILSGGEFAASRHLAGSVPYG